MNRRRFAATLATLPWLPALALAQPAAFPNHPLQMIIPYPAGGTTDVMARSLQEPLQKALGQTIIVENKAGAAGVLAAREVARGKPDGHTLLFVNSGILAVTPHVQKQAGFDPIKDFAPVALATVAPLFVMVPASLPVNDLRGFIDYVKKQPAPLSYASAGIGSFGHLASELFLKSAGIKMVHVPYKGQAPTTTAIVTGEVALLITSMSSAMRGFIDTGKLKLLAVTSPGPSALSPGVPPASSVLPGFAAETWFGFITTAGTPPEIVQKLNTEINAILARRELHDRMAELGQQVRTVSPTQLGSLIADDVARWGQVVREQQISAD
jgi:tripartite-type tricarboxylate transporter receptor subunit TctC